MKKLFLGLVLSFALLAPCIHAGGGENFAGAAAGSMFGSMLGSAMTRDSGGRREARQARTETEQLRREQELRREMYQHQRMGRTSSTINILIGLVVLLLLSILGLGLIVLKKKK
jgi:hypothetical protein